MKNLYSPYNGDSFESFIKLRLFALATIAVITFIFMLFITDISFNSVPNLIFLLIALTIPAISIISYIQLRNYIKDTFLTIIKQTNEIANGNFDKRITDIT